MIFSLISYYLYYYQFHKVFGDTSGCLICGWLGMVCAWSTRATVGSGHGWQGVAVARQADLSGKLGAVGWCASTARRSSIDCFPEVPYPAITNFTVTVTLCVAG